MELELSYKELRYKKPVMRRRFTREETMDIVIPDTLPDAARAVGVIVTPLLRSKDAQAGRVSVTGIGEVNILYAPESGEALQKVPATMQLAVTADDSSIREDAYLVASVSLVSADVRLINSRKVSVRAEFLYSVEAYTDERAAIAAGLRGKENAELMMETVSITIPTSVNERTFSMTDSVELEMKELLGQVVSFWTEDGKSVGNKAVVRGTAVTRLFYLTRDGELRTCDVRSPYSQVVELDKDYEKAQFAVTTVPTAVYASREAGDAVSGRISLEIHAVAQCVAYEEMNVGYIQDAFAADCDLKPTFKSFSFPSLEGWERLDGMAEAEVRTPQEVKSIDAVWTGHGHAMILPENDPPKAETPVTVCAFYTTQGEELFSAARRAEAAFTLPRAGDAKYTVEEVLADLTTEEHNKTEEGFAVRLALRAEVRKETEVVFQAIDGLSGEALPQDAAEKPSLIAYRVMEGDTLWGVSKRYRTPRKVLLEANEGEEQELFRPGNLLLIPIL